MNEIEVQKLLEEPDVSRYDWEVGKTLLANWKADLPHQIDNYYRRLFNQPKNVTDYIEVGEPKPDESRLPTEDEIAELWWQAKDTNKETPADIPYDFAKLIIAKTASIIRQEFTIDKRHMEHLIDDAIELEAKLKRKDKLRAGKDGGDD